MPAWALVAAASIAAAAGVGAVVLASGVLAVIGGTASAVTALLALDRRQEQRAVDPSEGLRDQGVIDLLDDDLDDDPIRALFEAGPPADGSGLLDPAFLGTTLRGRIAVARRALRPLSIVCFEALETEGGRPTVPVAAEDVAHVVSRTLREADVAGRGEGGWYVCILEDTGEDGAVWTAERIRRNLVEGGHVRRFHAGVAAYPTHGLEPDELEAKALDALAAARDWATDRIEVATA